MANRPRVTASVARYDVDMGVRVSLGRDERANCELRAPAVFDLPAVPTEPTSAREHSNRAVVSGDRKGGSVYCLADRQRSPCMACGQPSGQQWAAMRSTALLFVLRPLYACSPLRGNGVCSYSWEC